MLTDRRVAQLVKEGVLPRAERGRYELAPVVQAYIGYLRERSIRADAGELVDPDALDLAAERARLAKEQADGQEMKNAILRRELLLRDDVEAFINSANARVRARMLGVPSKAAPVARTAGSTAEAEAVIREAIYEALLELSQTSIEDMCGDAIVGVADAEAPAEVERKRVGRPRKAA